MVNTIKRNKNINKPKVHHRKNMSTRAIAIRKSIKKKKNHERAMAWYRDGGGRCR